MNASERNLLDESDRMTESMLVSLEDLQLAYLRAAMLHEVEETLNAALPREDEHANTFANSPARKGGVANSADHACRRTAEPHASACGYGGKRDTKMDESRVELLEAAR
jgi:hypothetical protein